jgi:hypothetical protein
MKSMFMIVPDFLKNPKEFYQSIQDNEGLKTKAGSLFLSAVVFLAIFGFITGLSHGWQQALSTAIKFPLLLFLTLAFTLPALYFFSLALLNIQFSVAQASVVMLAGISVISFLLLGLSPVTLFFVMTSSSYPFFQLLAVVFVAVSGFTGLYYILRGITWVDKDKELTSNPIGNIMLRVWVFLFGFVGAQLTWRLSPLVGDPKEPFILIQPSRDNFFVDVIKAFQNVFGLTDTYIPDFIFACMGALIILIVVVGAVVTGRKTPVPKIVDEPEK